jgi:hypothetical protein
MQTWTCCLIIFVVYLIGSSVLVLFLLVSRHPAHPDDDVSD